MPAIDAAGFSGNRDPQPGRRDLETLVPVPVEPPQLVVRIREIVDNSRKPSTTTGVLAYYTVMDWSVWLQPLLPVAIASIPLFILATQIRQQNRLERKKIEVEYLRQALEVLQTLLPVLLNIQDMADGLVLKRSTGGLSQIEIIHELRIIGREWAQTLHEFDRKLAIVLAYAAEQKLTDLQDTLQYAFESGHKLERVIAEAMKRGAEGPPVFSSDVRYPPEGEVGEFLKAQIVTSGRIVRRIKQLYD